jgi:polar amino acid transport system substrate-binding protein
VRRIVFAVVGVLAVTLTIAACGSQESSSGDSGQPAKTGDQTAAEVGLADLVPAAQKDAGKVVVATNAPYAPFEMFVSPGSKELTGLDVDLAHALGDVLGVPFEVSQQPFDGLIPGLQSGKYDVLMASLFDTREREKVVDFVIYGKSGTGILAPTGNPKGIAGPKTLCGVTVATQGGSNSETVTRRWNRDCTSAGKPAIKIDLFPALSNEMLALKVGRADAIVGDQPAMAYTAKIDDAAPELANGPSEGGYFPAHLGIGVSKANTQLRDAITKALQRLIENGKYQALLKKYGVESIAVDKAEINNPTSLRSSSWQSPSHAPSRGRRRVASSGVATRGGPSPPSSSRSSSRGSASSWRATGTSTGRRSRSTSSRSSR